MGTAAQGSRIFQRKAIGWESPADNWGGRRYWHYYNHVASANQRPKISAYKEHPLSRKRAQTHVLASLVIFVLRLFLPASISSLYLSSSCLGEAGMPSRLYKAQGFRIEDKFVHIRPYVYSPRIVREREKKNRLQYKYKRDANYYSLSSLVVDSFAMRRHSRLLECLGQRRVGVASACDILARSSVLESQGAFCNHLAGVGADDVDA